VHLQSRIVVGRRLPIGIGRNRVEVPASPVAVALRHLATHIDELAVPGELHQDPANSKVLKPLDSCLFRPSSHKASINTASEDKTREVVEELVRVGFFELRGTKAKPVYWVPFLYRDALNLVQGEAK
jgi:hypothetical protein